MRKYDDPNCVLDTGDLEDIIADFDRFYAESREYYKDAVSSDFEKIGHVLYSFSFNLKEELRREIAGWISQKIDGNPPIVRMYLYSLVLGICPDSATVGQALDYLLDNTGYFTKNNLYYYAYQLMVITFSRQEADSIDIRIKLWKLLNLIYEIFEKEVTVSLEPIPMEKRNPNLILVLTEQMVTVEHGPTKTALDRCKAIMTRMDKEVLLICTNEILSLAGKFPFAGVAFGHEGQYEDAEEIEWKGVRIPFFNVKESMPNVDVIDELLGLIRKLAPSRIVTIGGKGVLANLADRIIPCVDIGLCPSAIEPTSVSYQTLGRPMEVDEMELLSAMNLPESHIIESIFTSSLKPQMGKTTRAEFGLPKDAFVITIIGGRLEYEVTEEFLSMLDGVMEDDYFILFLGIFKGNEARLDNYDRIKRAHLCTATVDILSVLELCDLYVNPIRRGGGTSCVEAMFKGVPVVSTDFGDVAVNCGTDFCVKDYEEMAAAIKRYHDDLDFYTEMSEKARKRTEVLLDTEGEFVRILNEADAREKMKG